MKSLYPSHTLYIVLQASRHVGDLFVDLRDGHNLISLLEVLSGEHLVSKHWEYTFYGHSNFAFSVETREKKFVAKIQNTRLPFFHQRALQPVTQVMQPDMLPVFFFSLSSNWGLITIDRHCLTWSLSYDFSHVHNHTPGQTDRLSLILSL